MQALRLTAVNAVLLWAGLTATAAEDPARWVSPEALVYLGVTDLDETYAGYKQTAGYELLHDPAIKQTPSMAVLEQITKQIKTRLATLLDTDAAQLENPFTARQELDKYYLQHGKV